MYYVYLDAEANFPKDADVSMPARACADTIHGKRAPTHRERDVFIVQEKFPISVPLEFFDHTGSLLNMFHVCILVYRYEFMQ
jgi:hypothetical protein